MLTALFALCSRAGCLAAGFGPAVGVDYETKPKRVTTWNKRLPGVYRHTLEDPLPSRPDNHVVADVITACEILKAGEELVDEREAGELMHRSVHSVLHITVLLGVLHEGL